MICSQQPFMPPFIEQTWFLGAKAPLELAHLKKNYNNNNNNNNNGTENFGIVYVCFCGIRWLTMLSNIFRFCQILPNIVQYCTKLSNIA